MHQFVDMGETPGRSGESRPMILAIRPRRRMSQALVDLWGPVMPPAIPEHVAPIGLVAKLRIVPFLSADAGTRGN